MDDLTDMLLRYHRKNPLRVAFGTLVMLAQNTGEQIEQAYAKLVDDGLMEPVYHTVQRGGSEWQCYRITKKGLQEDAKAA